MRVPQIAPQPRRPRSKRIRWIIGLTLLVLIAIGADREAHNRSSNRPTQPAANNSLDLQPGPTGRLTSDERTLATNKLAEMVALFRHHEGCPESPRDWSIALITLESVNQLSKDQIAAKEGEMLALRSKIGDDKWCALYAIEMKEAYIIVQHMIQKR